MTPRQVAIITGGVSGIGEQLTRTLVGRGWVVVALDITSQRNLAQKLSDDLGDAFEFMLCDVANYQSLAQCFTATFAKRGRIDAFCSNAGIVDKSSLYIFSNRGRTELPPAPDTSCTDVCFKALMYGTQLAVHFMRQNPTPGGFIVATSSNCALYPLPSFPEYSGAKAAMNAFVRASAPILKLHQNISINIVCPGTVPTRHISQEMREMIGKEYLTPASTVVNSYLRFLDNPSISGQVVEGSRDNILIVEPTPYVDGEASKIVATVYDPNFKAVHGQFSGLTDILKLRA